jgi:predicted alpha/beta-fold hydrolase
MLRTASVGVRLGHSVFMVNHRGCGEGQGLAAHPYHSGRAEDLSAVIANGRRLYPNKKHIAVGFSLSANALLFLLSGRRGDTWPDAAIAVNGPIHLESASFALGKGLNRIYDFRFSVECRREVQFREKKGLLPAGKYKFPLWTSLRDFDSLYTAPASGFSSREDYYSTCSTHSLLRHITVPTLLITAKDDPFIDYRNYLSAQLSPSVALHLEENGGHMGYLTNQPTVLGTHRWLDYALHEYLSAV